MRNYPTRTLAAVQLPINFSPALICLALVQAVSVQGAAAEAQQDPVNGAQAGAGISTAATLSVAAILGGAFLASVLIWMLWRRRAKSPGVNRDAAQRVADAFDHLPSESLMTDWSESRLSNVLLRLMESDGYVVGQRHGYLVLSRPRMDRACVIIGCAASKEPLGQGPLQKLSSLLTDAPMGWFVSLGGFAPDALKLAASRKNLTLIDGKRFMAMLREVPPLLTEKVLYGDDNFDRNLATRQRGSALALESD